MLKEKAPEPEVRSICRHDPRPRRVRRCFRSRGERPATEQREEARLAHLGFLWLVAQVSVTPSAQGMPGGALIGTLLGWLAQLCLYGGVAAMFLGGLSAALSHRSGYAAGGSRGREIVLGGVVAAVLGGLGPTIVNVLYTAAR